jgi:cysteine-rich repeat protein
VRAAALAAGLAATLWAAGCGGDDGPECGNGVQEAPEECDDGNTDETDFCRTCFVYLPPRTTVKWRFNSDAAEGFSQDGCVDTGARQVRVRLVGPVTSELVEQCPSGQVVFDELPAGSYAAEVTPLDVNGAALVSAPVETTIEVPAGDSEHTVNVPPDAWNGPLTGNYFFRVRWEGLDCTAATPPVSTQRITLMVGGSVVSQTTNGGLPLDGSAAGPCVPASGQPQSAVTLPFGFATLEIVGFDGTGTEAYREVFDTFVGAGVSNPTLEYDVDTTFDAAPPPDAAPM